MLIRVNQNNHELVASYMQGNLDKFLQLIEDGTNINCLVYSQKTLMSEIMQNNNNIDPEKNKKFFDALILAGAHLGQTLLYPSILFQSLSPEIDIYYLSKLLNQKIDINQHDQVNLNHIQPKRDVVIYAIELGAFKKMDLLLKYNPDLTATDLDGNSPLAALAKSLYKRYDNGIEMLFEYYLDTFIELGIDINSQNKYGYALIHLLMHGGLDEAMLDYLIEKNIDLNLKDDNGYSALSYAIKYDDGDAMIRHLIKNGANLEQKNRFGETIPMFAVRTACMKSFDVLLDIGIDFSSVDNDGNNIGYYLAEHLKTSVFIKYKEVFEKNQELLTKKSKFGICALDIIKNKHGTSNLKDFLEISKKNNNSRNV